MGAGLSSHDVRDYGTGRYGGFEGLFGDSLLVSLKALGW
jgi:hypothetical protein